MPGGLSIAGWKTQVLGRLGNHPNIAKVVDYWQNNNKAAIMVTTGPLEVRASCATHTRRELRGPVS